MKALSLVMSVLALMMLSACQTGEKENPADDYTWEGKPASVLDRHPLFNSLYLEESQLADGSTLKVYKACYLPKVCCENQFFIKDNKVQKYETVGNCVKNKSTTPYYSGTNVRANVVPEMKPARMPAVAK